MQRALHANWNVIGVASTSREAAWDVLTPVERSSGTSWRTLEGPTTERSTTWNTTALVNRATITTWQVLSEAPIDLSGMFGLGRIVDRRRQGRVLREVPWWYTGNR